MKTINIFQFLAFLFLLSLATLKVEAQQNYYVWWDSSYSGSGSGQDSAIAMALDNTGNFLYVTGFSNTGGTNVDIVTIKYNRVNGNRVWTNRYDYIGLVDKPYAIAVDNSSGFVYVTGLSYRSMSFNRDFVTIKYNPATGDTLWTRRYNGAADGGDEATAIGIDNSGNIFVTGFSDQGLGGTSIDIVTIKYTSSGSATIDVRALANYQKPNALKIDNSGNVFVAGVTRIGGNTSDREDYITIKFDNSLAFQWLKTYNGTANSTDNANGIVIDQSGNIYVTGFSYWTGQFYNYVTIKYNTNGDSLNGASYNWTFNNWDIPTSIGIDNGGNVYVTGYSVTAISPTTVNDFATVKYNSSLVQQWVERFNGSGNGDDKAASICVKSDTIYVTGMSFGTSAYDYLTLKYNSSGSVLCTLRLSTGLNAYPSTILVNDSSNIYITGSSVRSGSGLDYRTVRYSLSPVGIISISTEVPQKFGLYQNFPNPFNPATTIRFDLAKSSDISIIVYDVTGRQVDLISEKGLRAGKYELDWNAVSLSSGIYFYTLRAGDYVETRKMILVK